MKILQLCYSKNRGGAAKACYRIHKALRKNQLDSNLLTCLKSSPVEEVTTWYSNTMLKQISRKIKKIINLIVVIVFQKSSNHDLHTFDLGTVINPDEINKSDADIIHLHWINYSMVGIKALRRIKKPIVWTFHDMWPFLGCEHYDNLDSPFSYIDGYIKQN